MPLLKTRSLTIISVFRDQALLVPTVRHAESFMSRLVGLLGSAPLAGGEGLLLTPCCQVHMFAMPFPVDVVFLGVDRRVMRCVPDLQPWRVTAARGAHHALELKAGSIAALDLSAGQYLSWGSPGPGNQPPGLN